MEVRLFATLRDNRQKVVDVDWRQGMDGNALFAMLDIPAKDVSIFLINGKSSNHDTVIKEDDVIALFPPVGGG